MNAIVVEITVQALEQAFGLPASARVTGIEFDSLCQVLLIRIDHPGLPRVPEGCRPKTTNPDDVSGVMVSVELARLLPG